MLPGPGCQSTGRKHWGRFKTQLPPDLVSLEPTAMSAAALPKPWSPLPHRPRPSPTVGIQYKAESLPPTNDDSEALCLPLPQTHTTLQLEKHSWPAFCQANDFISFFLNFFICQWRLSPLPRRVVMKIKEHITCKILSTGE